MHAIPWVKEEEHNGSGKNPTLVEPGVSCSRGDAAVQESDNSSSLDSLAARVKTLLEDERPVLHAAQILQSAEEEEKKVRAWVKMKLAAHSPDSVPDLNEEDRLMLEAIKKEHFLSARRAEISKDQLWGNGCKRISSHSPIQKLNPWPSKLLSTNELHQTHSPEVDVVQADTALPGGTDTALPGDPETKSLNSISSLVCNQLQAHSDNPSDSTQNSYAPSCNDTNVRLMGLTEAINIEETSISSVAPLTADSSSTETTTQITSITFASRKRSPSSISPVSCAGLTEAVPGGLSPLEAQSVNAEQVKPSKQQLETPKLATTASPAVTHALEKDAGVSSSRDHHRHVAIAINGDESHQEKFIVSAEDFQTRSAEQRVRSVVGNCEEDWATSPVATRLKKHDRPTGGGDEKEFNPEETMTGLPPSLNPPEQKTDGCPQDQLTEDLDGFVHMPKPFITESEESVLTRGDKFTFDLFSWRAGDANTRNIGLLPTSSSDQVALIMPVSPSSPTRKALSGVHITLSPRRIDLDLQSQTNSGTEMRQVDALKTGPHQTALSAPGLSLEATSKLKPTELSPKSQDSAYFLRTAASPDSRIRHSNVPVVAKLAPHRSWVLAEGRQNCPVHDQGCARVLGSGEQHLEDNYKITASSQTERLSSDAITQITTESPEKTTYSAEIFVGTDGVSTPRPPQQKSHSVPSTSAPALNQVSILNREAGKPLLLPYKPPGSSEMYYVPCPKETLRLSRIRSETTVESTHSGSNDAVPPEFPAQVLGSRSENPPAAVAIKHREGIYSKRAAPKIAWTDGKTATQESGKVHAKNRNPLESVKTTHSVFRSAQFYLHQPVPLQHEIDFLAGNEALGPYPESGHSEPASRDFFQYKEMPEKSRTPFSLRWQRGEEKFSPLTAEPDYSLVEDSRLSEAFERDSVRKELAQREARQTGHKVVKDLPLPSSQMTSPKLKQVAPLPVKQSVPFTASLDELWSKYLERQRQHQQQHPGGSSRQELSLVERLDRLARLLQNPVRQSLMSARERKSTVQEERRRKEPKKVRTQGKATHKGTLASHRSARGAEESPESTSNEQLLKSRQHKSGAAPAAGSSSRNLEEQNSEMPSDTSSELRTAQDSSVLTDINTSESDMATQAETETATQTEESVSVSTIDTARLIRAFGHNRVQVSPKLSQLYSTITLQKTRSETWAKGSRKAMAADYPKAVQVTDSVFSSDSISTVTSSRGPSPALSNKRNKRMLNKAVQAGDLEIVNSATKKNTRDVGLTFPTPTSSQVRLQGALLNGTEPDGFVSGSKGTQKRLPGSFLAERPRKSKLQWLQEDLKSNSKQGDGSNFIPDSNPSWFEPVTSAKPWREPLREKNSQEDHGGLQVRLTAPARDIENKPPPPFVKLTLQDALALRRPDFISRSGERVKRLKLIMEERKLQSMLQSEREELFNPPEERRVYRNAGCLLPNRDYRAIQRRAISKSEMVQRSKRIYEQLPEVRKRREEEKRKSDYSTYRLKAQLYKTKITNRILGRKVPWE
ncbi:centrosome-associated protein ALMS1 [Tiliqua scincoides]|uniref:centrosome-associated protein ALMS1 n=1 Tax=Tiliqua scincoides TaxID=71010 RepID=UPI0034622860